MATFTTATVTNRTTSGCTITFNAAAIDLNAATVRQLYKLLMTLQEDTANLEGAGAASGTVVLPALA